MMQAIVNNVLADKYVGHYAKWPDWEAVHVMSTDGQSFANVWRDADNVSTISDLHVSENWRGFGLGTAMLEQCENIAAKVFHDSKVQLQAKLDFDLIDWYVDQGYIIDKIEDDICTLTKNL